MLKQKPNIKHMETLQLLKDYAGTTDNVWLAHKLEVLELEIELKVIRANQEQLKHLKLLKI